MLSWHHSGFHVYVGGKIWPDDESGLENPAKYIVRACFSQQRMIYITVEKSSNGTAKVIYTSEDGRSRKTFDALDWLALLVTHIPARYEQSVRYYGYYSNLLLLDLSFFLELSGINGYLRLNSARATI